MIFNTCHSIGVGLLCVWKAAGRGAEPLTKKYLKKIIDYELCVKAPLKVDTFLLTVFVRRKVCKSKLAKPCRTNERVAPKGHRNAVNPRVVRHG